MLKSTLKEKTKLFLANRKNANLLPEILSSLYEEENRSDLLKTVRCFKTIFNEIMIRGDFNNEIHPVDSADHKYSLWLRELFIEAVEKLTKIMRTDGSSKLRDVGIETLVGFELLEQGNQDKFPKIDHNLIVLLIEAFLEPNSHLIENSSKLMESLKDFKFRLEFTGTMKKIVEVRSNSKLKMNEEWMRNVLKLTKTIVKAESIYLAEAPERKEEEGRKQFKKEFSKFWNEIMKWDGMTPAIVRQIVTLLPDHIMEHLEKPMHMSDFLLESFKISGPISVLSLRGIFILMVKYNFDVPDFYTKLYSLFQLPVLKSAYRPRFFQYADDFLASTHLPEYLVAAFVKKLSRMSLHAPTPVIPIICHFVVNLMIRHPGLQVLIHNTKASKSSDLDSDPFDESEPNPINTRAMESSLWEMKTLQNHVLPNVAQACSFIEKPLPKVGYDLEETLNMDYDDMFEAEVGKKKNIDPVEPKFFDSFDFGFSSSLQYLSDSIIHLNSKRAKISCS